jgi:hypothetical protein
MTQPIFTLADARDEKRNAELPALAAAEAALAEERRVAAILRQYPQIGVLGHGPARRYYFTVPGNAVEFFTSHSVDQIVRELEGE